MSDRHRFEDHIDEDALDFMDEAEDASSGLRALEEQMQSRYDRWKYYGESMTQADLLSFIGEVKRILRDLR